MQMQATGAFLSSGWRKFRAAWARPWLLCYVLLVAIAFQFLLKTWSEVFEIALFVAIVAAFLALKFAADGLRGLLNIATGTWTQRLAALFLVCLMVTFIWGDHSVRSTLALFRLPTYLVIIAMVVDAMRKEDRIPSLAWVALVGITGVFALILVEFYFGSDAVGLECADVENCFREKHSSWHWNGLLNPGEESRQGFTARGGNLNVSLIAEVYGISRLSLFAILAYALGIGLMLISRRFAVKLVAGGLVVVAVFVMLNSGSRSGLIGFAIVSGAFIALSAVSLPQFLVPLLVSIAAVIVAGLLLATILPTGETTLGRVYRMFDRESRVTITGLAAGDERLAASDGPPVVGHRIDGLAAGQEYVARLRAEVTAEGKAVVGYWTEVITVVAQSNGDGRGGCGEGCGSIVLTWYEPDAPAGSIIRYRVALQGKDAAAIRQDLRWWKQWQHHAIVPSLRGQQRQTTVTDKPTSGGAGGNSVTRAAAPDAGRIRNWQLALELFAANPIGGNGYRTFQPEARRAFFDTYPLGVHNGYLKVLSESGLVGALPMLGLFAGAVALMLRLGRGASEKAVLWRNVFLSALAAFLAMNLLDTHSNDRYFWVVLAFAEVAEVWRRQKTARPDPVDETTPAARGRNGLTLKAGVATETVGDENRS